MIGEVGDREVRKNRGDRATKFIGVTRVIRKYICTLYNVHAWVRSTIKIVIKISLSC